MGNTDTKVSYRDAINELTSRAQPIESDDNEFWSQFWHENHIDTIQEVFSLLSSNEIRQLRDESPLNLATLCYKAIEQLVHATDTLCNTVNQQRTVLTCTALLTRILPYIFEDSDWRQFFWSSFNGSGRVGSTSSPSIVNVETLNAAISRDIFTKFYYKNENTSLLNNKIPLATSLMTAVGDLLFCPDFTVAPLDSKGNKFGAPDTPPEDLQSIDSCEYIWEAGVGCSEPSPSSSSYDHNRTQLLRLLLTCFSESMFCTAQEVGAEPNRWIEFFTSGDNRHALPLFTSLLNTTFAYNPTGYLPFNHILFNDSKEPLVEVALQILIVVLDHDFSQQLNHHHYNHQSQSASTNHLRAHQDYYRLYNSSGKKNSNSNASLSAASSVASLSTIGKQQDNLFIHFVSRIHRQDDFEFLLKGFTRLLNNPLQQSYIPNSSKRIHFHQELLVMFWKFCDYNKKFMYYVLKTCDVLKILVPILYHLNDARADRSRVGLVHIGVFIVLLLSGERNFGVRLNRPYQAMVPMDLPIFSGTHADLLVIVFHKLITTGHQRLQPLFDCLLTILVNVSPYLKTLSMVASNKILHLLEAFSTPWFLFSNPTNHHLVFFLLEIFNNIIQYQFDGNSNLIYTIIRKRNIFHSLANLPTDYGSIQRSLNQAKFHQQTMPSSTSKINPTDQTKRSQSNRSHRSKQKNPRPCSMIETSQKSSSICDINQDSNRVETKSNPTTPTTSQTFSDFEELTQTSSRQQQEQQDDNRRVTSTLLLQDTGIGVQSENSLTDQSRFSGKKSSNLQAMNVTLAAVPKLNKMTEKMHPNTKLENEFDEENDDTIVSEFGDVTPIGDVIKRAPMSKQSSTSSEKSLDRCMSATQTTKNQQSWQPNSEWILSWKQKLPLQTIMRMLQVLVPQVEKMCIDKGITDENEILKFLQHGTLVGLLPVPHPILIRKYQTNIGTTIWFRTYMWGVIYLRNSDPPIWYDTDVRLFEIQKN